MTSIPLDKNGKRSDMTPLFLNTPKGGTFTVERKPGETAEKFAAVMQNVRSRIKMRQGIITACVIKGTTATVTVLSGLDKPNAAEDNKTDKQEVRAAVRAMQPDPPPPPVVEAPITGDEARALFKDVYLESLRIMPAAPSDTHGKAALDAAREFARRFPNA